MNAREAQRLSRRYLLPHLPGFTVRGRLTYASPLENLLRGFYLERSLDPTAFYLWGGVFPLFIPSEHIYFTYGRRIGYGWNVDAENEKTVMEEVAVLLRQEGQSFLDELGLPADLAAKAAMITQAPDDPNVAEVVAYSLLLAGQHKEAAEALERLDSIVRKADGRTHSWVSAIGSRSGQVRDALRREPQLALAMLNGWRAQTIAALGLPD